MKYIYAFIISLFMSVACYAADFTTTYYNLTCPEEGTMDWTGKISNDLISIDSVIKTISGEWNSGIMKSNLYLGFTYPPTDSNTFNIMKYGGIQFIIYKDPASYFRTALLTRDSATFGPEIGNTLASPTFTLTTQARSSNHNDSPIIETYKTSASSGYGGEGILGIYRICGGDYLTGSGEKTTAWQIVVSQDGPSEDDIVPSVFKMGLCGQYGMMPELFVISADGIAYYSKRFGFTYVTAESIRSYGTISGDMATFNSVNASRLTITRDITSPHISGDIISADCIASKYGFLSIDATRTTFTDIRVRRYITADGITCDAISCDKITFQSRLPGNSPDIPSAGRGIMYMSSDGTLKFGSNAGGWHEVLGGLQTK